MSGDPLDPQSWFVVASEDLAVAKICFASQHLSHTLIHRQQAVEKALKGYLISHNWKLSRTHEIGKLIEEARLHGVDVTWFTDMGKTLSFQYFGSRYPDVGAADFTVEEVQTLLTETEKLLNQITPKKL